MTWIPIDTDITAANWLWDGKTAAMLLHLLGKARKSPKKWTIVISRRALSEETGLSQREVRTALAKLEATGWVKMEATNQATRQATNQATNQNKSRATNHATLLTISKRGGFIDTDNTEATNQNPLEATTKSTNQATNQATNSIYIKNINNNSLSLSTACAYVREEEIREAITEEVFWERLMMLLTPAPFNKTEPEIVAYADRFIREKMAKANDPKWRCDNAGQLQALCTNYIKCEIQKEQRNNGSNKPHRETDDEFIARAAKLAKSATRDPFEDYDF